MLSNLINTIELTLNGQKAVSSDFFSPRLSPGFLTQKENIVAIELVKLDLSQHLKTLSLKHAPTGQIFPTSSSAGMLKALNR